LDAIHQHCRQLLDEAVNFASESPVPEPSELSTEVYVMEPTLD
jgi:TPP-dependent pyruvate/acetoin dehydrogenase alpha subunit